MNIKKLLGAFILLAIVWFAYYTISPLLITIRLDEELPTPPATQPTSAPTTSPTEPAIIQKAPVKSAQITGTAGHPASGTVRIVESEGKKYLRYENFKTINGPDIFVYLANDLEAKDFVNLGRVKATEGNVNYEIPVGTDPSAYRYAMVWCDAFNTLFNYADISTLSE